MNCPKCGSADQLAMSDGVVLCLDCRHEHDGKTAAPPPLVPTMPNDDVHPEYDDVQHVMTAATTAEVLSVGGDAVATTTTTDGYEPTATPLNLAGRFVHVRNSDDVFLCTEDDGSALVQLLDSAQLGVTVLRSDIVHVDDDGTDPLAPVVGAETVAEDQPLDPTIFAVASLAIAQGLACIGDDGETLHNPRIGWLPPPCNQVPEAEQGVAYAIALLIITYGLDRDSVAQIAATLMQGATGPETETQQ